MTTKLQTFALLAALLLFSCKETPKPERTTSSKKETVAQATDEIIKNSSTDKYGKKIEMTFNNTKGDVQVIFNGETFKLSKQPTGSGIHYKNDKYELRGKGNDLTLTKDGKVLFENSDEIINKTLKNKKGDTLTIIFNNTTNQAKIYLNDEAQIELVGQEVSTGMMYKNDHYEFYEKAEKVVLKKDGKTIFEQKNQSPN